MCRPDIENEHRQRIPKTDTEIGHKKSRDLHIRSLYGRTWRDSRIVAYGVKVQQADWFSVYFLLDDVNFESEVLGAPEEFVLCSGGHGHS